MSTYDPQRRVHRPKADEDAPAPVDDLLEQPAPAREVTPPAPKPKWEDPPTPGGGKGKAIGIGVAVTAVLFALRWALKRRHRDD